MRVRFSSGTFFISATITDKGEIEDFEMGDEAEETLIEGVSFEVLSRLFDHLRLEQGRLLYPPPVMMQQGGPVVGGNREEPPIEGEING